MKRPICGLAWLALLAVTVPARPDGPMTDPALAPISLSFHNGSVVQPAVLLEAVEIDTKLGKLSVPAGEVRRIDFGFRLSAEDARKVEQLMRDLGSSRFQARDAATKALIRMGRLAYPALLAGRKNADLETSKRVEAILKDIRARVPASKLQTRLTDILRTSDSTVTGQITAATFRVRSELFGELKVPVAQLREVRSLLPGSDVNVAVDAAKYGSRTTWLETNFEVTVGTRLEITATGEINLDPLNQINNPNLTRGVRPDGIRQLVSNEGYLPGQLLGRIGTDGPTFVVGSRHSAHPEREGKLFLRMATLIHANNIRAEGSYQVRIAAEPN
jgi:hypothetical protein